MKVQKFTEHFQLNNYLFLFGNIFIPTILAAYLVSLS